MAKTLYEVFYIDKFTNSNTARVAMANLRTKFKLNSAILKQMSSRKPISIKRHISLNIAEKYCQALIDTGGTAWVEEMVAGIPRAGDRRADKRRLLQDRRDLYRGSAIVPDRRASMGRRSVDS